MITKTIAAFFIGILIAGSAQAALHDRGGGLIYDDVLNVTWLKDANYAQTSGYDTDGLMTWTGANVWAASLSYGGYSDWRLPKVQPIGLAFDYTWSNNGSTDLGWGISSQSSELSYMFYVNLGNKGLCAPNDLNPGSCEQPLDWGLLDVPEIVGDETLFTNLQAWVYWSSSVYLNEPNSAWGFNLGNGGQADWRQDALEYVWAVRDGDVSAIPESENYAMMLVSLPLLGFAKRHRSNN